MQNHSWQPFAENAPAVSVVAAVYKGEWLNRLCESVAAQTFTDWECILEPTAALPAPATWGWPPPGAAGWSFRTATTSSPPTRWNTRWRWKSSTRALS